MLLTERQQLKGEVFVSVLPWAPVSFASFNCRPSRRTAGLRLASFALSLFAFLPALHAQQPQMRTLDHHVRPVVTSHRAALTGRLADDRQMRLSVILLPRNQDALAALLKSLYDPASPNYRHFLTVQQFTDQFGPTDEDYAAAASYLSAQGLVVAAKPANRLIVSVTGTAAQINTAFKVQMSTYQHPTEDRTFFSPDREPSLPANLKVRHITGLDNFSIPHHFAHRASSTSQAVQGTGSGPGGSFLGSDMRAAYYGGTTLDGTGQSVGLLEFGGYDMDDVTATFTNAGQSTTVPINDVLLDGAIDGSDGYDDSEQVLDIVQAIGMAPGLSQVRVYIGYGQDDSSILNSMASENIAKQLSCSWGWLPADPDADDVFFEEMAAQGQSFFAASGDDGAFDAQISPFFYPGDDQYVTAVGGTHLTTSGPAGSWVSETVWNSGGAGSGGGISPDGITIPSYQTGIANSANAGSATLRNVPDVAMEGDFDNYACGNGGCDNNWAGTSFAAPRWAGFMALVNQQAIETGNAAAGGIGFLNPTLYQIAQGANASTDLHDIVSGNNLTSNQPVWYSAVAGYDLTTGWGSPTGQSLIDDLAGPQAPGFWLTSSPAEVDVNPGATGSATVRITDAGGFTGQVALAVTSTLPSGVTASFASNPTTSSSVLTFAVAGSVAEQNIPVTVTGTSGSITKTVNLTLSIHTPTFALTPSSSGLALNPGQTVTATVTVTPEYGFTGPVALAISGLPTGVTASFSPASTTGTSTLTLTASASATSGTTPLTITGTSGGITVSANLSLDLIGPSFQIYTNSQIAIGQGSTVSSYLEVWPQNGFSGSVSFTATNLPTGVTAVFSPNPATGTSSVAFTAAANAPTAQSVVTITGTSGSLTASTPITVSVKAPSFTLATGNGLTLGQGSSISTTVYIQGQYGFSGNVALSVSGLPAGVTPIWGPNPTTGYTQLYLYASSTVTPGQYPITITGTSGSETETTTQPLSVVVPSFTLDSLGSLTVGIGSTNYGYVSVSRAYGFSGNVALSISGLPSGVTASFSPATITGTYISSSLSFVTSASVVPGQYPLTITGTSGGQTATTSMTLIVAGPSFSLYANGLTVGQGLSGTTYLYVYGANGFSGAVNLSVSGLPTGVTASFSSNPTSSYSQITFNVGAAVPVGSYPITITGTVGSMVQTTTTTLYVGTPSFTLSSYGVTVGQGQTSNTWVYANQVNGFASPITMSIAGLPSGVTASFSTNPTTSFENQVAFTVASSVPAGQYPLTITGTSGSETETTTMTLTVGAPSFSLFAASAPTIGLNSTGQGFVYVQDQYGFTGSVNLSISGLPSGVTASLSTNPTTYSSNVTFNVAASAQPGNYNLTFTGVSGSETETATMQLTVAAPTFSIYGPYSTTLNQGVTQTFSVGVFPQYGFTGNVTFSASGLPSGVTASFSPNPSSTTTTTMTLTAAANAAPGSSSFTVTGTSGSITIPTQVQIVVNANNFSLLAAPAVVYAVPGATAKSTINVVPINGFTAAVNLSVSGLPSGVTAAFSSASATTASTLTFSVANTAAVGSSTITVTGVSGSQTASAPLLLTIRPGGASSTTSTLALSASSVSEGTAITATAAVTAGSSPLTAGLVYLCETSETSCGLAHHLAVAPLNTSGNAVFRFVPGPGSHSFEALFAGTTAQVASTSAPATLAVTASLPTSTTLAETGAAGSYTLTATVTGHGAAAPSGSVSFTDTSSSSSLGTAQLAPAGTIISQSIAQTLPVAGDPAFTATADFNGDGIPDLAVSSWAGSVTILLGTRTGSFTTGATLQPAGGALQIATCDFNRDGNIDIAVIDATNAQVDIFFGNGDGTFTTSTTPVYTLPNPIRIVVADLNGDGFEDLAVLNGNYLDATNVTVLLGHGDGTFTPATLSSPAGSDPVSIAAGDFNGDGIVDLAVGGVNYNVYPSTQGLTILLGNGDGSFTTAPAIPTTVDPVAVLVADFNHDGKQDIAVGGNSNGAVNLFLGNGDGTFTAAPNPISTSYVVSLATADVNHDSIPDLIVADSIGKITTLLSNGDGTFSTGATVTASLSAAPEAVVAGDWNGDGVPDLAFVNYEGYSVSTVLTSITQRSTAVANVSPIGSGPHVVNAAYPGDTAYVASTSSTVNLTGGNITWLAPAAITYGTPLGATQLNASSTTPGTFSYSPAAETILSAGPHQLTATFTPSGSTETATATVSITVNPALLTIAANNASRSTGAANPAFTGTITGAVNNDTFTETFSTSATAASLAGTYPIVPAITGANLADYTVTASNGTLTVTPAPTLTPTTTTLALSNQNLTLTGTVTAASGTPTGTVTFFSGQTSLGSASLANGTASLTLASFPSGNVSLSAQYSGDATFAASQTQPLPILSTTPALTSLTLTAPGTVTDNITFGVPTGYTGALQLSCTGLPQNVTCVFQPASISFSGTSTIASTTLTLTASSSQARGASRDAIRWAAIFTLPGLFPLLVSHRRKLLHSRLRTLWLLMLLTSISLWTIGCGGGSGGGSSKPSEPLSQQTTVQIVASGPGGVSESTPITVTVNY